MTECLLTRAETAEILKVPPKTLATWAYRGVGPPFVVVGRHARYRIEDLEQWLQEQRIDPVARRSGGTVR